jgi:putative endonuclease
MSENIWKNYILANKLNTKTYIGSTVNINRRLRQHNEEIKGGAKYTKGIRCWKFYCVLFNVSEANNKCNCLSNEWHLKFQSRKSIGCSYKKRNDGVRKRLLRLIEESPNNGLFKFVLFVSKDFLGLNKDILSIHEDIFTIITDSEELTEQFVNSSLQMVRTINEMEQSVNF